MTFFLLLCLNCHVVSSISGFLKRGPRPPLGLTERFSGGHNQRLSLGSFAVILHNPSVMLVLDPLLRNTGDGSDCSKRYCD